MTTKASLAFLEELARRGWNPFEPSEECRAATHRPGMIEGSLTELDRIGIHRCLLAQLIMVRFRDLVVPWNPDLDGGIKSAATLFAMKAGGHDISKMLSESEKPDAHAKLTELTDQLDEWEFSRKQPACERIYRDTLSTALDNRSKYEPGVTLMERTYYLDLIDYERSVRNANKGLELVENRGVSEKDQPGVKEDLRSLSLDESATGDLIEMILKFDSNLSLFTTSHAGRIVLSPKKVRDALERNDLLGKVQPVSESLAEDTPEDWTGPDSPDSVAESVATLETMRAFRKFRVEKSEERLRLDDDEPLAIVIDHFDQLYTGETSVRELAKRFGVDRGKVGIAFSTMKAQLIDRLSA